MANEVQCRFSLALRKGSMDERLELSFNDDMETDYPLGPTPGSLIVTTSGIDIDLSQITTPGWCMFKNLDETNYIEVGIRDPETSVFYYLGELLPGKGWPIFLSRNFGEEYAGPGTGTTAPTNLLHLKANTATCNVSVKIYER